MTLAPTTKPDSPDEPPTAEFAHACRRAAVSEALIGALWRLHALDEGAWPLADLLHDHERWLEYLRSRHGDARAAHRFHARWSEFLAAYCRGRLPAEDAEEVAARFFERTYRLVEASFHWQCPFELYLRVVVVNASRDVWKRREQRHVRETSLDALPDQGARLPSNDASPELRLLDSEATADLRSRLSALAPGDHALLVAFFLDGESGDAIAKRLGVRRQAVYQRLHRARARAAALLSSSLPRSRAGRRA